MAHYDTGTTCYADTWSYWCADSGTGTACTTAGTEDIWHNWNTGPTAATTVNTYAGSNAATIWYTWTSELNTPDPVQLNNAPAYSAEETRAGREREQAHREAMRKERDEQEKKRKAAEAMALDLLEMLIGPEERQVYEETGRLLVKGKQADYMISKDFGVERVERGKIVDLCIHLRNQYGYPATDNVIALALAVKDDEAAFNRKANNHGSIERARPLPMCANAFN